jgi:hypothetical protein
VSRLESIYEELRTLPPDRLERVAGYVHAPGQVEEEERRASLLRATGSLTEEEADENGTHHRRGMREHE